MSIIYGAMAGMGEAAKQIGAEELLRIGKEADLKMQTVLLGLREEAEIRGETRKSDKAVAAGKDIAAARDAPGYDPATDSVRPQTAAERARSGAAAAGKAGLLDAQMRGYEQADAGEERAANRIDKIENERRDNDRGDRQLAEQIRHNQATERAQGASNARLAALAKIQVEAATFELGTKKELAKMQDDFAKETDPAKRATLERNILSRLGKAKELPEPVRLYVGTVEKELAVYAKADADGQTLPPTVVTRRAELQRQMQSLATTGALNIGAAKEPDGNPRLDYGFINKNTGAKWIGKPGAPITDRANWDTSKDWRTAAGAAPRDDGGSPAASGGTLNAQQKREAELRAQYEQEQGVGRRRRGLIDQEFQDNIDRTASRSGM